MKENKYDDNAFFEQYSKMLRSKEGLKGAGEWYEFRKLMPDFKDKKVLDLGCGYGWHCQYAAEHGAKYVLGTDISKKMINVAREKNKFNNVEYKVMAIEDIDFPANSYDIVLSSLTFHYVASFEDTVEKIKSFLRNGGDFVFSIEHPVFTAEGSQKWIMDENSKVSHWPVDNYFFEGQRNAEFLGEKVIKYHKTLTTYINTLLEKGFQLNRIIEPKPSEEMLKKYPDYQMEMKRPMMLLVSAKLCNNNLV